MLNNNQSAIMGIFTNGGGNKRFKVRKSLVELAINSKRPLVPYRSLYSPTIRILGNDFPYWPLISGKSLFGKVISYKAVSYTHLTLPTKA